MTLRATISGILLAIIINVYVTFSEFAVRSSLMTIAHIPVIVLCPLFLLTAVVNPALIRINPAWRLSTGEIFGIFAMGLIASAIPGFGFANYFFRVIIPAHYFASPENRWASLLFPYLPDWLVVQNDRRALTYFFEGLPAGEPIPWQDWLVPIVWWLPFIAGLFLAGASVIVLLRKQWIEHEKLSFPLAQIPIAMIQQEEGRAIPPYLRNRLFWIGFSIPIFIIGWNVLNYFVPIGVIPIGTSYQTMVSLGRDFPAMPVKINFLVLACAFFTHVEVLFSIWFFQGTAMLMVGLLNRFGASASAGTLGLNSVMLSHYFGGFVVLVLWSLWTARRHLAGVVKQAVGRLPDMSISEEIVSYRSALISLVCSVVFIAGWLTASGMTMGVMIVFLSTLFILYLGIARIVAETGLAYLDMPVNANEFTVGLLGSGNIAPQSLASLGLANVYARNWRLFSMTSLSHLLYAERAVPPPKTNLFGVLCLSGVVGMITVIVWTLYMGYNPDRHSVFGGAGDGAGASGVGYLRIVVTWMQNKTTISDMEQIFFGLGGAIAGGLIALRYAFPGWPLHPIGFAIAGSNVVRVVTFAIFLAWAVKVVLLRVGGVTLYKKTQPFFIGMLAGYTLAVVLASIVDAIWFPGQGHAIHTW
ncbi:MAG: hypothetical protein FJY97_09295 [candidate division Zixibacteria bacterium]|nr:hypothetical protein [candidate division Zixibacteria bacterium]